MKNSKKKRLLNEQGKRRYAPTFTGNAHPYRIVFHNGDKCAIIGKRRFHFSYNPTTRQFDKVPGFITVKVLGSRRPQCVGRVRRVTTKKGA